MELGVLLDHPDVVAVDKPPGIAVIPARGEPPEASLHHQVQARLGFRLWVVHRLDRDTSGIVLFAKRSAAHRALSVQFEHREVEKTYLALTRGVFQKKELSIETPLHSARRGKMRPAHPGESGALTASTDVRLLRQWATPLGDVGLIEARPHTGRQHQIRVHLRSVGAPLLVDPLYGGSSSIGTEELGLGGEGVICRRLTLHAASLVFAAPTDGEVVRVLSPLAADLAAIVDVLDGLGRSWAPD